VRPDIVARVDGPLAAEVVGERLPGRQLVLVLPSRKPLPGSTAPHVSIGGASPFARVGGCADPVDPTSNSPAHPSVTQIAPAS